jgi:hypothetical protein
MSTTPSTPPPSTSPSYGSGFAGDDDTSSSGVADKAQGAKHAAQETASTAADETKHVAGVAGEEVKKVASEAKDHARGLLDEARGQVDEQTRTQRDRLVGTLGSFSSDLRQMADQSDTPGLAADVARQVAARARSLGDHLDGREPADLIEDVRSFARRRPGVFLAGALAAGVLAGRLARGAKAAQDDSPAKEAVPAVPSVPTPPPAPPVQGFETVGQPQSTAPVSADPLTATELAEARSAGEPTVRPTPGYAP